MTENETPEREHVVTTSGLIVPEGIIAPDSPKDIPLKVDENGHAVVDVEAARAAGWKLDHTGWYRHA